MNDRFEKTFARCASEKRPAFIAYVCAGDPNYAISLDICRELLRNGTDILELGVPFSDPVADGPVNQRAALRALNNGMTHAKAFELARELRKEFDQPIVFYTYYNMIHALGVDAYCRTAQASGVSGILALDCPPEEAGELLAECKRHELSTIFIVAPTTPDARISLIASHASGFIYYVSRLGVTGTRDTLSDGLSEGVARIKAHTALPVAVGFGVSKPEHVVEIGNAAEGVIVGSALVKVIENNLNDPSSIPAKMREQLKFLLGK